MSTVVDVEHWISAAASATKRIKRILVAEAEGAVNKKAFAIDTVVGDCSAANHRTNTKQRLEFCSNSVLTFHC